MSILHDWLAVSIEVQIDPKWTWIARQPWGEYMLFTSKPVIYRAVEDQESDFVPCYWKGPGDEQSLSIHGPVGGDWCRSCRKLGKAHP